MKNMADIQNPQTINNGNQIDLSSYSKAFIDAVKSIKRKSFPAEATALTVSQTVSFFAILYEKVRNAVEFREEHLIRRAAIERILKRKLLMNPDGHGEGENLVRELLWARYLPNASLTDNEIEQIQTIINNYLYLKKQAVAGRPTSERINLSKFIADFLTCEIEEQLNPEDSQKKAAFLHFFYQVLKNKILIKNIQDLQKDTYFYIACENAYVKNDSPYIKYHLFRLSYQPILGLGQSQIESLSGSFSKIVRSIEKTINNPFHQRLVKFARRQTAPFSILFTIINRYPAEIESIITTKAELWKKVDFICREKYQETKQKLQRAAVRSIIYIFLTKMVFVLMLEYPLSRFFYKETGYEPLIINALFPPFLMGLIISLVAIPSEKNTKKIFFRIINILNKDPSFETSKTLVISRVKTKRPLLIFGFTIFYLLTFGITFTLIYLGLDYLKFNLISKGIFIFFLSVVSFFGYRIRQTAKEYQLEEKDSFFSPIIDFFFMPILSVGKFLSSSIAKINIFILIFDFLIEAPFKLIFEIVEEWINFVKARKEEIV